MANTIAKAESSLQWLIEAPLWLSPLADWISLVGLAITIGALVATFLSARKAAQSASEAERAVDGLRNELKRVDLIVELSKAIEVLDEIRRVNRSSNWSLSIDRYTSAIRSLTMVIEFAEELSDAELTELKETVTYLQKLESLVEAHITTAAKAPDVTKTNKALSLKSERIHALIIRSKRDIGNVKR